MMSAKMATPVLLTKRYFEIKFLTSKISVHDVPNKMLSGGSNYIVNVVMWKIQQSLVALAFLSETLSSRFYNDLTRKAIFFRAGLGSSSIIWDWQLVRTWNFTLMWQNGSKYKPESFGDKSYVYRVSLPSPPTPLVSPRIELIKLNGVMHFVSLFWFCFNYIVCVKFSQGDWRIYDKLLWGVFQTSQRKTPSE